jgi:hypothetical protein
VSAPVAPIQQNVLVALNHGSTATTHHKIPFELDNIEIPGGSFYSGPGSGWPMFPQYDFAPPPTTLQVDIPRSAPPMNYAPVPVAHVPEFIPQSLPVSPLPVTTITLPHHPAHHRPVDHNGPFRPSIWEWETSFGSHVPHPALCQTAIFRK